MRGFKAATVAGRKATAPMVAAPMTIPAASGRSTLAPARNGGVAQSTITGATTVLATASVSHQIAAVSARAWKSNVVAKSCADMAPAVLSIAVGTRAMSTNRALPSGVKKVLVP